MDVEKFCSKYDLRVNMQNNLVLRKEVGRYMNSPYGTWRDACATDLATYYKDLCELTTDSTRQCQSSMTVTEFCQLYRFRAGIHNLLILQVKAKNSGVVFWRDAKTEDLPAYFTQLYSLKSDKEPPDYRYGFTYSGSGGGGSVDHCVVPAGTEAESVGVTHWGKPMEMDVKTPPTWQVVGYR